MLHRIPFLGGRALNEPSILLVDVRNSEKKLEVRGRWRQTSDFFPATEMLATRLRLQKGLLTSPSSMPCALFGRRGVGGGGAFWWRSQRAALAASPSAPSSSSSSARRHFSRTPWKVQNRRYTPNPLFEGERPLYAIIGVNVAVFGCWSLASDRRSQILMQKHFTISPFGLFREWRVHTLLTSFFSHRDGWHLAGNMFTLFFFGREALYVLGGARFTALYFTAGLFSSACFALWPSIAPRSWPAGYRFGSGGRSSQFVSGLGASGAVSAIVAWSVLSFPTRIVYLYGIVPLPAFVFGVGYLLSETYGLYSGNPTVANVAHLGGAAVGGLWFFLRR